MSSILCQPTMHEKTNTYFKVNQVFQKKSICSKFIALLKVPVIGTTSKCPRSECSHQNITMITQTLTRTKTIILMPDPSPTLTLIIIILNPGHSVLGQFCLVMSATILIKPFNLTLSATFTNVFHIYKPGLTDNFHTCKSRQNILLLLYF